MPSHIAQKQQEFIKEREENKKSEIITREPPPQPEPPPRKPTPRMPITAPDANAPEVFDSSKKTLKELQQDIAKDSSDIQKRLRSSVQKARHTGTASHEQQQIIDSYFQRSIMTAIDAAWKPPGATLVSQNARTTISFTLSRNGTVSNIRINNVSGYHVLDDSARTAIENAIFPPFPDNLSRDTLTVEVPFEVQPE